MTRRSPLPESIRLLPSGRFQARYKAPDGSRRTLGTYPTLAEALTAIAAPPAPTFNDFAMEVLDHKLRILKRATVNNHRALLRRSLLPTFGDLPLDKITAKKVDQWFVSMPPTVNRTRAYAVLHNYLAIAVRWDYLLRLMRLLTRFGVVREG